jgi:hypothetical protein
MGSVFGRWAEIVGQDLAAHTRPDSFADGELAVTADSTAWATQVRLLAPVLLRRGSTTNSAPDRSAGSRSAAPPRPGSAAPGASPAAKAQATPTASQFDAGQNTYFVAGHETALSRCCTAGPVRQHGGMAMGIRS